MHVEMSHQPERALTPIIKCETIKMHPVTVEMSHQPERALTPDQNDLSPNLCRSVEMSHQPERALTLIRFFLLPF